MSRQSAHEVHVRIRRLSLDPACHGAHGVHASDFGVLLQNAIAERSFPNSAVPPAREQRAPIAQIVANAVADRVRSVVGHIERT
ncbi:MAG TPA: hypothetical protein VIK60_00210 [Vicinamibacterales bacterium]